MKPDKQESRNTKNEVRADSLSQQGTVSQIKIRSRSVPLITDASHINRSGIFTSKEAYVTHRAEEQKRSLISNNLAWCSPGILLFFLLLVSMVIYFTIRILYTFHELSTSEVFLNILLLICEFLASLVTIPVAFSRVFQWTKFQPPEMVQSTVESITILVCGYNIPDSTLQRCIESLMLAASEFGRLYQIVLYDYVDDRVMELAAQYKHECIVAFRQKKNKDDIKLTKPELINFVLDQVYPELATLEGELVCFLEGSQIVDKDIFVDAAKYFNMDPHLSLLQFGTHKSIMPSPAGDIYGLRKPMENHLFSRLVSASKDQMAFETNFLFKADFVLTNLMGVLEICEGAWGSVFARKFHKMQERCYFTHYAKSAMYMKERHLEDTYRRLSQEAYAKFEIAFNDISGLLFEHLSMAQVMVYRIEWFRQIILSIVEPILVIFPIVAVVFGVFPIRCESTYYAFLMGAFLIHYGLQLISITMHRDFFGLWTQQLSDKFLWWVRLRALYRVLFIHIPIDSFTKPKYNTSIDVPPLIIPTPYSVTQDVIVHVIIFVLNFASMGVGIWLIFKDGVESSVMMIENIPFILMCLFGFYNSFVHLIPIVGAITKSSQGRAIFIKTHCFVLLGGILAICLGILYLSLQTRPIDYDKVISLALDFYQIQKSGMIQGKFKVDWRGNSDLSDAALLGDEQVVNLTGGFYHGAGAVKMTLPIAYSMSVLALAFKLYPSQFTAESKEKYFDVMKWGGDYLWKTVIEAEAGGKVPRVVVQIGDLQRDLNEWTRPEQMRYVRPVLIAGPTNPAAEVYAMVAAGLSGAGFAIQYWDQGYTKPYMQKAMTAYAASWNSSSYSSSFEQLNFAYASMGYFDELMYAAAWLSSVNTGSYEYQRDFIDAKSLVSQSIRSAPPSVTNLYMLAETVLAITPGYEDERNITKKYLEQWIEAELPLVTTPDGLTVTRNGRRNVPTVLDVGLMAAAIGSTEKDQEEKRRYICWAFEQLGYVLGQNSNRISYMVGYSNKYPLNVRHKAASCPPNIRTPCTRQNLASRSPNPSVVSGGVVNGPDVQGTFRDERANAVQNEPFIENSAAIIGLAAMAKQEKADKLCLRSKSLISLLK
eukprot:TRINITY_DN1116_c0_g1_i4.p1 TRINITY_DN1116_c0_g1~~TRINITY_DN1116_c0_g1_i4.p1  ORF type:complete len:1104 (-),score=93.66 TRINITY_DN1116_c0_g1_i4:304-3615(-)